MDFLSLAALSVDPFITSDLINFDDLSLVLSTRLDQALFLTPATENSSQKLKLLDRRLPLKYE